MSICLSVCLSVYLSAILENEAILRDFPIFFKLDNVKNAILRDFLIFLNLTKSKLKQFCETPSVFEVDHHNKAIRRDFLQTWKGQCRAGSLVPMRFVIFPLHLCKVLRLPRKNAKVVPGHTKCCTCQAKSSQQTCRSDAPKCNPSQEISAIPLNA